jgi:PAS domain S-box-containing protein
MRDKTWQLLRASGGRMLPHTCVQCPEEASLGEGCPLLPNCLRELHPVAPAALIRFALRPDGSSYVPFATPNLKDIHGHAPEEVREDTTLLFACVHPQDFDRVAISMIQSARAVRPWISEHRVLLPPRGEMRWLRACFLPQRNGEAGLVGYGLILDITAEKDSRSELLRLCERGPVGVLRTTPDGHYLSANVHFANICGYDSPEALIKQGGSLAQLCYANPEERETIVRLTAERGSVERYALELRTKDGGSAWISMNVRAVRDESGNMEALECYCADISEQVREGLASGRMDEMASTSFGETGAASSAKKPARTQPGGLCHLLTYVRDALLWRVRLPGLRSPAQNV